MEDADRGDESTETVEQRSAFWSVLEMPTKYWSKFCEDCLRPPEGDNPLLWIQPYDLQKKTTSIANGEKRTEKEIGLLKRKRMDKKGNVWDI